jgi:hypothetical protein
VTNNTQSNAIYPGWRRDGLITYIDHPMHPDDGSAPRSAAVVADPKRGHKTRWDLFNPDCTDLNSALGYNKAVALGALWTELCSQYGGNATANTAALNTLSINPVRCRQMVHDYWEQLRHDIAGNARLTSGNGRVKSQIIELLSESDLQAACPQGSGPATPVAHPSAPPAPPPAPAPAPPAGPVPQSCVACHTPRINFNDLDALSRMRTRNGRPMIQEILRRLNLPSSDPHHMPQGEDLTPDQKQRFIDYLNRRTPPPAEGGSHPTGDMPAAPATE